MRCLVGNSEMLLLEAVQADANTLPGCQHHTFLCSSCHDVERRLVFTGVKTITATARPDFPASKVSGGGAPNAWGRAVEKLLTRQAALKGDAHLLDPAERNPTRRKDIQTLRCDYDDSEAICGAGARLFTATYRAENDIRRLFLALPSSHDCGSTGEQ